MTAAKAVVDDYEDHGIDAIYYHEADQTLYLVQSKMKEDAQFQLGEAQAFIEGVKLLLNKQFHRFNQNVQNLQANIEAALDECESIQLLVAYTGNGITIQAQNYLQPAIKSWLMKVKSKSHLNIKNTPPPMLSRLFAVNMRLIR